MEAGHSNVRARLSVMMFLEFFLWASWYVAIGGYMNATLGFTGTQIGWIYTTTAIGAMISPLFVGYVADRFFPTERALGVLHLLGGVCLFLSAGQQSFGPLMALLVVNALCFMPTLALANSLAFRNIDDPDTFPRIAMFGTIGWIVSLVLVEFILGGAKTGWFFYLAGTGAVAMGLYSFSLPHTPPKGPEEAGGDVLGLRALRLLKEPSFLVFAVSVFLISIPLTFYFQWGVAFLDETDRPAPVALTALGQCCEVVVMLVMPWFIGQIGLKRVLVIGMAAWVVRYLLFASLSFPLILLGLFVHGFCYCFVFVAAFIYADKTVPRHMSASAQSFIAFLMWGVGMFVGAKLAGFVGEQYPPDRIAAVRQTATGVENVPDAPLPDWDQFKQAEPQVVDLAEMLGSQGEQAVLIAAPDPVMVVDKLAILGRLPEEGIKVERKTTAEKVIETRTYAKKDLLGALNKADANVDGVVTRPEWREARSHTWPPIWLWPGVLALAVCLLFFVGGRDVKSEQERPEETTAEQEKESDSAEEPGNKE